MPCPKLIEVALPLEAINTAAVREKSIRHGHPSTLHLWWARRPLATARAILFAQLVDDPDDGQASPTFVEECRQLTVLTPSPNPQHSRTLGQPGPYATLDDTPRNRLFDFIAELVEWENTTNPAVLSKAQELIRLCTGDALPPVLDPFSGGCTIPLEAQRLGLEAHGSDLNPVAVLIGKASIEIPPRFEERKEEREVRKEEREKRKDLSSHSSFLSPLSYSLAADVRRYGQWMKEEAQRRIGHLYPKAKLPGGGEATVIAWLWCRTVASPNPAAKGAHVPLVNSFVLSTKKGMYVEPVVEGKTYRFVVRQGAVPEALASGTVGRSGAKCLLTNTAFPLSYIRAEGKAGRLGQRLLAIVAEGHRERLYLDPSDEMEAVARSAEPEWKPESPLPTNPRNFNTPIYGLDTFDKLFTPRQLVALTTFSDLVAEAREQVQQAALEHPRFAGKDNEKPLAEGGDGARAYAEAVGVYLSFVLDKSADYMSAICSWNSSRELIRNTFGRQAIPMVWDFAEANPFSRSTGNWVAMLDWVVKVMLNLPSKNTSIGSVLQLDATETLIPPKAIISTDPPYYDNIGYADLSDFFYIWLRRSLKSTYPELFSTMLTPKDQELIATPYRHGNKDKADQFFMAGMTKALHRMVKEGNQEFPAVIYYAFKQAEKEEGGISSTGWATFLEAMIEAGFSVGGTWPMRSELGNRMNAQKANALASSIVMVCRPRPQDALMTTRVELLRELRRELPKALRALTASNIAPVDMAQASIGPGMAIFSKYAQVYEADGSRMPVRVALQLINGLLDEFLAEQEGQLDADTRFAVTWFEAHGFSEAAYGEAETLATARGVSVAGVQAAGLIVSKAGKVQLKSRDTLPLDWHPKTDQRFTVWEAVQHLARINETKGAEAAGSLIAELGEYADHARQLAYRLYGICDRKGWSSEGQLYNALVTSWGEAKEAAARIQPPQEGLGLFA